MPTSLSNNVGYRQGRNRVVLLIIVVTIAMMTGWAIGRFAIPEPTVDVQMYVAAIDDGADIERYAVEQEGDQFTHQLTEDELRRILLTPYSSQCVDGLSITSVWTSFARDLACPGTPHIRVVLVAPY